MIDQLEDYKLDSPIYMKVVLKLGMVVWSCNSNMKEWKQEDLGVWKHPGPHSLKPM